MSKKSILVIGAVLLLLVAAGGAYYVYSNSNDITSSGAGNGDSVTADDHVLGSAKAPITMVEYFAQACSACSQFDQTVFPLLKAKYIDTGKVRYVMRLFPLFPIDGPSYKLDMCVPPDQFFQSVDLLFRNQPQWDSAEYREVTDAHGGLIRMARIMGLSPEQADACMNSAKYDDAINKVAQDATTRYSPNGTPTFVVDFQKVTFPQNSWTDVQTTLDAALAAKGAK